MCPRSVSTAHMSFNLVRYSVTVDSSSFAVSLFLGDSISFTSRESIDQTCFTVQPQHAPPPCARITKCVFVASCLFRAHSCLLRAPVPCARVCGRATHGLPTVYRVSMLGTTSVPSDAQAGWHRGHSANSVLCLSCVVVARAFDRMELWSLESVC